MTVEQKTAAAVRPAEWPQDGADWFPAVDPHTPHPLLAPLFGALREAGRGPINLHRVLANAPEFYEGFLRFGVVLRGPGETSRAERELAILRTVQQLGADYEFAQHRRIGQSVGLGGDQIDALADWRGSALFDPRQRLILELTDAVVQRQPIAPPLQDGLRQAFSPGAVVELTLVSVMYVAIAHLSHALPIPPGEGATRYGE
mgnify:CR=1 FL=1